MANSQIPHFTIQYHRTDISLWVQHHLLSSNSTIFLFQQVLLLMKGGKREKRKKYLEKTWEQFGCYDLVQLLLTMILQIKAL